MIDSLSTGRRGSLIDDGDLISVQRHLRCVYEPLVG